MKTPYERMSAAWGRMLDLPDSARNEARCAFWGRLEATLSFKNQITNDEIAAMAEDVVEQAGPKKEVAP